MQLNNLLASPGFSPGWKATRSMSARCSIRLEANRGWRFSRSRISNDAERMFFVTLLLNQTLGWVRAQSGTTSLRAILYMDEIFGYFPPSPIRRRSNRAYVVEAGPRVRSGRGVGDAESRRSGLQRPGEYRHLVHWTAANRTRQGARVGRTGRRRRKLAERSSINRQMEADSGRPRQSRVSHEQCARRCAGGLSDAAGRCPTFEDR